MTHDLRHSVLFACVHNAGRSQMAAAYAHHLSGGAVEARSAGSAPADTIDPAVCAALLEDGIDISAEVPKILTTDAVLASDVVVTMGCGDTCPVFPGKRYEDWVLDDPAGRGVDAVRPIRDEIKARVRALIADLGVTPVGADAMTGAELDLREEVRQRYATSARRFAAAEQEAGCCGPVGCCAPVEGSTAVVFGRRLYDGADIEGVGDALDASLGCGVPTAVADLKEGEVVLDLGSGAGGDVLISARRVGDAGRVYGLDMTDEMLDLARRNAAEAGVTNVEFLRGYLEEIPLPDASVDVVISNCVINLAADKSVVLAEAARVTRSGGRFAVSDVVADPDMDAATRADIEAIAGCIGGALTEADFRAALESSGWSDVTIDYTHRVHRYAQAAIVRATRR